MKRIFYNLLCRERLNHTEFNLNSEKFELIFSDEITYYLKRIGKNKYYKISRKENGEELTIYRNWLKI